MSNKIEKLRKETQKLTLLYIEDDAQIRESTAELLEGLFEKVLLAVDGEEGWRHYTAYYKEWGTYPDIVLTDIRMPKLNGIELSRKIHAQNPDQQIVVFSAYERMEYYRDMLDTGITAFTLKPLYLPDFYTSISKAARAIREKRLLLEYGARTEKRLREQTRELTHHLYYDDLSQLRNRKALLEEIDHTPLGALILINIDSFSMINDLYGMETGNTVISKFSSILLDFAAEYDYEAFRLNADEFVLYRSIKLIDSDRYYHDIQHFLRRCEAYKIEISQHDDVISLEVTIGLAFGKHELLPHADMALRYARNEHRSFAAYSSLTDNKEKTQELLVCKRRLKSALSEERVLPVFQPIVDLDGFVVKYEVLMRLREEEQLLSPWSFLDAAFKTRLYRDLSQRIISQAFAKLQTDPRLRLSINISYLDMKDRSFLLWLEERFKNDATLAERITFEIVESEMIEEQRHMVKFIHLVRSYGAKIAIDDFGSGFSNFSYILQLRPDFLKIDGSLVKKIDTDHDSRILVETIAHFSKALGIATIAEFVHNDKIFSLLKEMGVELFQGYYLGEPKEEIV